MSKSQKAAPTKPTIRSSRVLTTKQPKAIPAASVPVAPTVQPGNSKQLQLVTLLKRAEGGTLDEMMSAMAWQRHSVRDALSGVLKKRWGYIVDSKIEERGRVYRIVGSR